MVFGDWKGIGAELGRSDSLNKSERSRFRIGDYAGTGGGWVSLQEIL